MLVTMVATHHSHFLNFKVVSEVHSLTMKPNIANLLGPFFYRVVPTFVQWIVPCILLASVLGCLWNFKIATPLISQVRWKALKSRRRRERQTRELQWLGAEMLFTSIVYDSLCIYLVQPCAWVLIVKMPLVLNVLKVFLWHHECWTYLHDGYVVFYRELRSQDITNTGGHFGEVCNWYYGL